MGRRKNRGGQIEPAVWKKIQTSDMSLWWGNPETLGVQVGFKDLTPLHGEWIRQMVIGNGDYTLQAHRGAYKSSCLALAIALIMVIYPRRNIIFIRKADNDVAEMIGMAAKILRTQVFQDMSHILYSQPLVITSEGGDHLTTNLFTSAMGAQQLQGLGLRSSITGKHAFYVITDDICNLDDRRSKAERERTKMQYDELQNIRNRGGRIINLGTPWHKDDVFTKMPNVHKYDCYTTGLISAEKLQQLRASMTPSLFAANYELKHIASEEAVFDTPPVFTDDLKVLRDGISHVDAAYGGGDYTAFTCGKVKGGTMYLYGKLWHRHVDRCLDEMIALADQFLCWPMYCEDNGDKGFLKKELDKRDRYAKTYTESQNKVIKITTHLRSWWPRIVFVEGTDREYVDQILDYTENAEHDDAADSAACVCRILDRWVW